MSTKEEFDKSAMCVISEVIGELFYDVHLPKYEGTHAEEYALEAAERELKDALLELLLRRRAT